MMEAPGLFEVEILSSRSTPAEDTSALTVLEHVRAADDTEARAKVSSAHPGITTGVVTRLRDLTADELPPAAEGNGS